jgi:hypothetical protein
MRLTVKRPSTRERKCPPDGQFFEEGGEKAWSRDDVALRCRFPHV